MWVVQPRSSHKPANNNVQSRSFTNLASKTSADDKRGANGNALGTSFGTSSKSWGGSIWGTGALSSGLASKATTRDSSISREAAKQGSGDVIEGKTGSGSLVESSVSDDWSYRSGFKRNEPSARSLSQVRYPETNGAQQRSSSNAGLPQTYASSGQNVLPYAYRPPTVSLNATNRTDTRPSFGSGFASGMAARGSEQPPNVYTKFDRPSEAALQRKTDSAVGSWTEAGTLHSPTDERRPAFSSEYFKSSSMPGSRNGSLPPSRHGEEQPVYPTKQDYSRTNPYNAAQSSRNPSLSSQSNGYQPQRFGSNAEHVLPQFGQLTIDDSRSQFANKPTMPENGFSGHSSGFPPGAAQNHAAPNGPSNGARPDEVEEIDRSNLGFLGLDGYSISNYTNGFTDFRNASYDGRGPTSPGAMDFRPGQYYSNGNTSPRGSDQSQVPRSPTTFQEYQNAQALLAGRRAPVLQDAQAWLDPRLQQMMAAQLRNPYASIYPYGVQNGLQLNGLSPYIHLPVMSSGIAGLDSPTGPRDTPVGDGVQSALMYEFKSNTKTSKRYELKDIYDHIAEFSGDQHGSRFIQQKLETANSDEKERVFREIQPNAIPLMTDVFGNYVIQKFFEHGDQNQKKILANKMRGQVLNLSLQMYGCRVVQKALEHILVDQQALLIREIENSVLKCVKDQNGNHVVQKAIERCPPVTISFIISAFQGNVQHLSIHPYGCRVIQRCLEHCDPPSKQLIMQELHESMQTMIADQYGNYVVQHVVEHGGEDDRRRVLALVGKGLESYSKHKFASNVVEKCLSCAGDEWRRGVVAVLADGSRRIDGEGVLVGLIKDNYGNYVIRESLKLLLQDELRAC